MFGTPGLLVVPTVTKPYCHVTHRHVETIKRKINIKISGYDKFVNFRDLIIHQDHECTLHLRILLAHLRQDRDTSRRKFPTLPEFYQCPHVMFSFDNPVASRDVLFKGVVSHLSVVNRDGAHAGYRVKGYSQTIAMEELALQAASFSALYL